MQRNVGGADKGIRLVAGLAILGAGVAFRSWWGLVGLVPLATSLLGVCPAYLPFRLNTCKRPPAPHTR